MKDWNQELLGILCENYGGNIQTGPFGSQLHQSDYTSEGVPVVMPKDIINDKIDASTVARISFKLASKLKKHILRENDILFPRRGDIAKRVLIEKEDSGAICGTGCLKIKVPEGALKPKFLYYYLKNPSIVEWIVNQSIGATMENLNTSTLKKLEIFYPDLPTQHRIASILSAYDDLIEVNNQRIKLLEETARSLYKEWFLRMRFPGYKQAKFVKGVPEGWKTQRVAETFEILGGGTPSTERSEYWDGTVNWYTPTDITASDGMFLYESKDKITEKGYKESSAKLFPAYSIMMTSRATIGAIGINTTPGCTNQGFITCLPNENVPLTFLYFWLLSNKETFEMLGTGSTFLELTKGTFKKVNILVPPSDLVTDFDRLILPMFNLIEILQQQNTQLRQIRDRLLPRLISGKLALKNEAAADEQG